MKAIVGNMKNYFVVNCHDKKYENKDFIIWGIIGAFIFITVYGILPLNVTYDHWIFNGYVERDVTQHYAGWLAFRQSDWTVPLGKVDGLGGTVVTYTDSIPWVAIFFKIFRDFLPETFQYFGIYIFVCFILQAISSGLLVSLFSKDRTIIYLGVVLNCYSPIMIERAFRHTALASHWLILFMLYFYFKSRREKKMDIRSCIIPVLCIGIHPYFLPIVFGLMFANLIELLLFDMKSIIRSGVCLIGTLIITVGMGYLIGALGMSSSLGGEGYGFFSMNLNAIINPTSVSGIVWSRFLKVLPQTLGNYDGFNYLGVGIMFLSMILVFISIVNKNKLLQILKGNIVLIILCIGFSCFAVSNIVTLNGKILFQYPLPKKILSFAAIFRASSRIFYPVYYLIILAGINGLLMLSNYKWHRLLLSLIVIVQIVDISPALKTKYNSFDKDSIEAAYASNGLTGSNLWKNITHTSSKIKMLNNAFDYRLAAFGEKYHLDPDISISSSHYSGGVDLDSIYQSNIQEIQIGDMDMDSVYVTSDANLLAVLLISNSNVNLYSDAGYYVLTAKEVLLDGELLKVNEHKRLYVSDLTDENWTNGISNFNDQRTLLFKYSENLLEFFENIDCIYSNSKEYKIERYERNGEYIQVSVDKNAKDCSYPNGIFYTLKKKMS